MMMVALLRFKIKENMAFIKQLTLPNGVVATYHKIKGIEATGDMTELEVRISSWPTLDNYLEDVAPIWNQYVRVPIGDLYTKTQDTVHFMEPMSGSTLIAEPEGLFTAKARKWSELKLERDRREYSGFVWDGSGFDSDTISQSRIQGAIQLAILAQQSNQPFSINWTLADNSTRVLNGAEMIQVGMALAQHVQALHETARILRAQVDAASTIEQLQSVAWPV